MAILPYLFSLYCNTTITTLHITLGPLRQGVVMVIAYTCHSDIYVRSSV